mgnify:CR=1 FL=1
MVAFVAFSKSTTNTFVGAHRVNHPVRHPVSNVCSGFLRLPVRYEKCPDTSRTNGSTGTSTPYGVLVYDTDSPIPIFELSLLLF